MARELLPYFNASSDGYGLEGLFKYTNNTVTDNWLMPVFLLVMYGVSIYVSSKSEWQLGGVIFFASLLFAVLGMIAQTFVQFNQLVMFGFILGMVVGIVVTFVENAR